jgi:hypothetical protein
MKGQRMKREWVWCLERGRDNSGEGAENHDWHAGVDGRGAIRGWGGTGGTRSTDSGWGVRGCIDGRCWHNDKPRLMSDQVHRPTVGMLT